MPVGKAKAATKDSASDEFRFVVPCMTQLDEGASRTILRETSSSGST